jgi:prepilin-type N-terminal cleavage/methylation domain-containing protein
MHTLRRLSFRLSGTNPRALNNRSLSRSASGFTLVELLAVMAIMVIMFSLLTLSLGGIGSSQSMSAAGSNVKDILDRARTLAMSHNTYTWVGFYEQSATAANGTAGTGTVVVSTVESMDGTQLYSVANPPPTLDPTRLAQAYQLQEITRAHLDVLSASAVPRADVPADPYQLGDSSFNNGLSFQYPITGTPLYTFTKIIQFNPQGDATRVGDMPATLMEIGLQPANGNVANINSKNLISVQIAGIGGKVTLYRP